MERPNIGQHLQMLKSGPFMDMLQTANIPLEMMEETTALIEGQDSGLETRAKGLLEKAEEKLREFYGEKGDIVIPFSGGYDSMAIVALTLRMAGLKGRKAFLVTAVTGMEKAGQQRAGKQVERLREMFPQKQLEHLWADFSPVYEHLVIKPALTDSKRLGWPSLCASCKTIMEIGLAMTAKDLASGSIIHMPWGYNLFQASLAWTEQDLGQRKAMEEFIEAKFLKVHSGSPLYNIIKLPIDPILLFGALGLEPKNGNGESHCAAAGLNPQKIDDIGRQGLYDFVLKKAVETLGVLEENGFQKGEERFNERDYVPVVKRLRQRLLKVGVNVFNEDERGHSAARGNVF